MAYGDFKNLTRRTASDKIFRDKAFNIGKNPKYYGYQCGVVSVKLLVVAFRMRICQTKN